jgi:hypothetical protein
VVTYIIDTVDTSYPSESGQYTVPKRLTHDVEREVREVDPYELLRTVIDDAHRIDQHEDREFLRVRTGGTWKAPFHPHNDDGDARWAEAGYRQQRGW